MTENAEGPTWLERLRPKIKALVKRKEFPDNLWENCPSCGTLLHHKELREALRVCKECGHHLRIEPNDRFASLFDAGAYTLMPAPEVAADPLKFKDSKKYTERLKDARAGTDQQDAVVVAYGGLGGVDTVVACQNFAFMGGSMGLAAGEALVVGADIAIQRHSPYIVFSAAGGARMQEGILSLMQMARTTVAVEKLRAAKLPFISVLTDPTTGGVTASYAMLGDINIAEPAARIGFAGRRVIEQTVREQLPEGFQRAEYLYDHGMLDMIVPRAEMRDTLARTLRLMVNKKPPADPVEVGATPPALVDQAPTADT